MDIKTSPSVREEALEVAYQTRRDILLSKSDPATILRACLLISNDLSKKSAAEWVTRELSGYGLKEVPDYRRPSCPVYSGINHTALERFEDVSVHQSIHYLLAVTKKNEKMSLEKENDEILIISPNILTSVLEAIVDKCFQFLNETITELQYGGVVEFLMEEIRRKTDEKLAKFDAKIAEETQSLYFSLTSTNPADWSKVGHSSRKILKLLADHVFPASNEKYTGKNSKVYEVKESNFINRLYAFFDTNSVPDEKKFIGAQIEYLESYLRQVVTYAQIAEHNPSIDKFHANLIAIHTYLVMADILRHLPDSSAVQ